jgi:hypothetical protein
MVKGVLVSVSSTFGSSTTAILFLSLGSCQSIIMDEMRGPYHEIEKGTNFLQDVRLFGVEFAWSPHMIPD